ncbi:I78 family peptidase inhibitor [Sphingomonas sp. URHD0057]|uniref:I78 family peptidase inhibitor n=1 Tax=Sphingomonas sp. URHD0057 TaxID=1380389 RepID=UPI0005651019|nr:I78 family peptidase inhibitor [Sphingomonas sp. URHD0057]
MRKIVLIAPALLVACSTAPAQPVVHGQTPGHTCVEGAADSHFGEVRSDAVGKAILAATHAAVIRWAPPNVMLTMDYRADRVTIWLDEANKITKIRCG